MSYVCALFERAVVFHAVRCNISGRECLYTDGGILDQYPIHCFDRMYPSKPPRGVASSFPHVKCITICCKRWKLTVVTIQCIKSRHFHRNIRVGHKPAVGPTYRRGYWPHMVSDDRHRMSKIAVNRVRHHRGGAGAVPRFEKCYGHVAGDTGGVCM